MTESIADRTHRAAVAMWEGTGCRGPRPTREGFAHLELVPDLVPAPAPAPADVVDAAGQRDARPTPSTTADAEAVKAALRLMQGGIGVRGSFEPPTDPAA